MLSLLNRQTNLKFLNFYSGKVDNQEGPKTKEAYKAFQKSYGLAADGIYGAKTDAKLVTVIKEIQSFLKVNADGIAGQMTYGATKQWQISQGLTADGIFGEKTRARMTQYLNSWDCIKYHKKSDFTCKCGCGKNNIQLGIVKIVDDTRAHYGKPSYPSCGTRCAKHNKEVGGVANSRHLDGKAIDFRIEGVSGAELVKYTKTLVAKGLLRYTYQIDSKYVHVDIL